MYIRVRAFCLKEKGSLIELLDISHGATMDAMTWGFAGMLVGVTASIATTAMTN